MKSYRRRGRVENKGNEELVMQSTSAEREETSFPFRTFIRVSIPLKCSTKGFAIRGKKSSLRLCALNNSSDDGQYVLRLFLLIYVDESSARARVKQHAIEVRLLISRREYKLLILCIRVILYRAIGTLTNPYLRPIFTTKYRYRFVSFVTRNFPPPLRFENLRSQIKKKCRLRIRHYSG